MILKSVVSGGSGGGGLAIGDAISGSTSGSLLFVDASSQLAQDNSNIFYDATNKRLGLTATPTATLHVNYSPVPTSPPFIITGTGSFAGGPTDTANGVGIGIIYNAAGNRQFWIGDSSNGSGWRIIQGTLDGWNYTTNSNIDIVIGSGKNTIVKGKMLALTPGASGAYVQNTVDQASSFQLRNAAGGVGLNYNTITGQITIATLLISTIKSGATQGSAGAAAGELWKTASHATLPDNVVMIGV